jgi:hypothetical protein
MKQQLITEAKRFQQLAGIITENINEDSSDSLETKIQQWANEDAGGYGPDEESDPEYPEFKKEMDELLSDTLEAFDPGNYGDSTSMSPDDILEDFIDSAIDIISKYTMDYYGDSTSFSPSDIRDEFYKFIGTN